MKHLLRLLVFTLCLLSSSHALRAQRAKYASLINALREAELFDEERRAQLTTLLEQDTVQTFPIALDSDTKLLEASVNGLRLQTSEIGTTEVRLLPASQRASASSEYSQRPLAHAPLPTPLCPHLGFRHHLTHAPCPPHAPSIRRG